MVYRGRPSTGCKQCRERKIKCDERLDGCAKCAERGFVCPGYDRTVDVFFRDETASVQAKAKKSKARAIAARHKKVARETSIQKIQRHESPSMILLAPLVDQGINFFIAHYTVGLDQPPITSQAFHRHLSTDGFHPLVATTMTALGLAGVANLYMDSNLKREATRWYLTAIRKANEAISSPTELQNDTTLVAVNLLSMFEATFNDKSLSGWSNHVDGASLLVKMRGMNQFSTPAGRRMYLHTVGLLTMNCMGQGVPMPDYVQNLNGKLKSHLDMNDPRHAFFFLHIKLNDLRAQIINQTTIDPQDIIHRALELDAAAVAIFDGVSEDWQYDTVPCFSSQPGIFGEHYHVYPSHAAAQTWNWVRYNRIYFYDIIRNSILAGFATSPPILAGSEYIELLGQSTWMLQKLQSDIIASMPQFLHDTPKVAPIIMNRHTVHSSNSSNAFQNTASDVSISTLYTSPETPASSSRSVAPSSPHGGCKLIFENFQNDSVAQSEEFTDRNSITDRLPIVRVAGGYSTVWALYVAGSMPTASPASQDFVLHCLDRIERNFGINQAKVLGNALRIKRKMINGGETAFAICPRYLPPDPGADMSDQAPHSKVVELPPTSRPSFVGADSADDMPNGVYDTIDDVLSYLQ